MDENHQDKIKVEPEKAPQDEWELEAKSKLGLPRNKIPVKLHVSSPRLKNFSPEEKKTLDHEFDLTHAGAIAISVIIIQSFLSTGVTDGTALAAVLFLALSIPMVSAAILLRNRSNPNRPKVNVNLRIADTIGLSSAAGGIMLTFFHISVYAGWVFLFSMVIALTLYSVFD